MEKCKFCPEMLEEGSTVCPACGRDNAEDVTPAEEVTSVEEAAEETASVEETVHAEETPAEEASKPEEKKATPGKLALVIGAIVVVAAVIAALLMSGKAPAEPVETEAPTVAATEPAATIPADGNPDDETCKGTYTVSDEEVKANAATVVAAIGDNKLTNGQLQPFYWMQVQSFLSSEYGQYMMYYGVLDYTKPLDTQVCAMTESGTWQQFFLAEALNSWRNYCVLDVKAQESGMDLTAEEQMVLDGLEESLKTNAEYYGLASVEELLAKNMGAGASVEDYKHFQELLIRGNKFYDAETAKIDPGLEDLEAFYAEHEQEYIESGISKDSGKLVDVRHVLFVPEGGTTDENGNITYSEEEWADCEAKAQDALNAWTKDDPTEESFAAMATAMTQDPGSQETGGLYEGVQQGQMVEAFDAWCFDEKREPGHNGIVKTEYGYHLMYFVGSTPIWENYTRQDYIANETNAMMEELTSAFPMEVDYSAITLGYVNMAG